MRNWLVWFVLVALVVLSTETSQEDTGALTLTDNGNEAMVEDEDESYVEPDKSSVREPFIPTKDWKTVKKGQSVPSGLHIRLNLKTGEREAKLMEGDDGERFLSANDAQAFRLQQLKNAIVEMNEVDKSEPLKFWQKDGKQGIVNTKKDSFSRSELKEALKKFKVSNDDERVQQIKKKFRSIEQLKQDMKDMNMNIKTDLEIMDGLMHDLAKATTVDERLNVLEVLEHFVHQIDNAQYLVDNGGLQLLVANLNHSEAVVSRQAASVIGSAVQSNPHVQLAAVEVGLLHQLVTQLAITSDPVNQRKQLFAISSLVRHYPYAQENLAKHGGLQIFVGLLQATTDAKVKIKVITLLTDLILEREHIEMQYKKEPTEILRSKLQQYSQVDLVKHLQQAAWCQEIPVLLSLDEHDSREKVIIAMNTVCNICHRNFQASLPFLKKLQADYSLHAQEESNEEDSNTFFKDIMDKISDLIKKIEHNGIPNHIEL